MIQLPSYIMGFREGLEAFLLIAITLKYITKIDKGHLKNKVIQGSIAGLLISLILGLLLSQFSKYLGGISSLTKLWESAASLIALTLLSVFIVWMIRHGTNMKKFVENELSHNVSTNALFWIALIIIAREGTEIAIFSFAGQYPYEFVSLGVLSALILSILIFYSLVNINLSVLFKITLAYLILQAGFLLGYSLHEGFSALKSYGMIAPDNYIFAKAFNFSNTLLSQNLVDLTPSEYLIQS